jgi:hypothetical protein
MHVGTSLRLNAQQRPIISKILHVLDSNLTCSDTRHSLHFASFIHPLQTPFSFSFSGDVVGRILLVTMTLGATLYKFMDLMQQLESYHFGFTEFGAGRLSKLFSFVTLFKTS